MDPASLAPSTSMETAAVVADPQQQPHPHPQQPQAIVLTSSSAEHIAPPVLAPTPHHAVTPTATQTPTPTSTPTTQPQFQYGHLFQNGPSAASSSALPTPSPAVYAQFSQDHTPGASAHPSAPASSFSLSNITHTPVSAPQVKDDHLAELTQLRREVRDLHAVVGTLPKLLVAIKDLQERSNQLERVVFSLNANINSGNTNTQLQQLQLQAQVQLLQHLQNLAPNGSASATPVIATSSTPQQIQRSSPPPPLPISVPSLPATLLLPPQSTPSHNLAFPAVHLSDSSPLGTSLAMAYPSQSSLHTFPSTFLMKSTPPTPLRNFQDSQDDSGSDRSRADLHLSAASLLLSSSAAQFQDGVNEVPVWADHDKPVPLDSASPPSDLANLIIEIKRILKLEPNIFDGKPSAGELLVESSEVLSFSHGMIFFLCDL